MGKSHLILCIFFPNLKKKKKFTHMGLTDFSKNFEPHPRLEPSLVVPRAPGL